MQSFQQIIYRKVISDLLKRRHIKLGCVFFAACHRKPLFNVEMRRAPK